jgi:NAD(P)-dependent dehydrogenase (short-subunit alcohol dehydrogenase family)
MGEWTQADAPDQSGKGFVVTGANSGIGLSAARMLAEKGATVVLACRDTKKGEEAAASIRAAAPSAQVQVMALDLSSLASVRAFAAAVTDKHPSLDGLINNAGVMAIPRRTTAEGFEMQLGTNHLGHFALTALLLDALERAPAPRVVNVSSGVHKQGAIRFDDLQGERSYSKWGAYAQSKLANLLFTHELGRRLRAAGKKTIVTACHPGYAATNLQQVGPTMAASSVASAVMRLGNGLFAQSADMGALPTLYAAVHPDLAGGEYIGPSGLFELRGYPKIARTSRAAQDEAVAQRLFGVSEELTKVAFAL